MDDMPCKPEAPLKKHQLLMDIKWGTYYILKTGDNQKYMVSVMPKQDETTTVLLQQNVFSIVPARNILLISSI